MALPNLTHTTTLTEDRYAALAMAKLNRQVKAFHQGSRAAFYELKTRYIKALYQHTPYVVGIWHIDGLYEFHVVIDDENCYVWHQLPQEIDYPIQCGGQVIYAPYERRKPITANEWRNAFAAVEAWLLEVES